jgi:hypothetical protein
VLYLHEITYDSFVVLEANWPVDQARQIVRDMTDITHVIVHRVEGEKEYYYLYSREEAQARLDGAADTVTIRLALGLHEYGATAVSDAYTDAEAAPDRVVVLDGNDLVGFYDVSVPPSAYSRDAKRGDGNETTETAEPVTRFLLTDFPQKVPQGQKASLLVSLSSLTEPATATGPALPIALSLGTTVDVVVQAKRGFKVVGPNKASLTVLDVDETLPLYFELEAAELGPGQVRVFAFQQGNPNPLGMITLNPLVVAATATVDEQPLSTPQKLVVASVREPDLQLMLFESSKGSGLEMTARLTATDPTLGLFLKPFDLEPLQGSPSEYFREFFKDVDNLPLTTPEQRENAALNLAAKGSDMFETLLPKDLQTLLWDLRERIKTVRIVSDEPLIPWELCKLSGKENGRIVEGPFLCEAFNVTRWMPDRPPRPNLTLNRMAVVAPKGSGLKYAPEERDFLLSMASNDRKVERITARLVNLTQALGSGEYDGWHFTGHGVVSGQTLDQASIGLEENEALTPRFLSGRLRNLGLAKPLVFLNGCETGQGLVSLTGFNGWADKFLMAGAAAFVGSYWSIVDRPALEFAKIFYGQLLAGVAIGEAVRAARLKIKQDYPGDPTWLAYTVFADPLATVEM